MDRLRRGIGLPKHRLLTVALVTVALALMLLAAPAGALAAPWATQSAPAPAGLTESALGGVSCASSSWCMAVGDANNGENSSGTVLDAKAFAESWNGSGWATSSIAPAPGGTAVIVGLSCTSPTFCLAVGAVGEPAGPTPTSPLAPVLTPSATPLAEVWNGVTWAPAPALGASARALGADLTGVSCLSNRFCVAVGTKGPVEGGDGVLVEVFNGTGWQVQATPPLPHNSGALDAVSCVATDACTAVGDDNNEPKGAQEGGSDALVEHWNGHNWSVQPSLYSKPQDGPITLTGVSCRSRGRCLAVGTLELNGGVTPRAESWNGSRWVTTSGLPPWSTLEGVSCSSPTACVAVGQYQPSYYPPASQTGPLVESWNGDRWAKVATPDAVAPTDPDLSHDPTFPSLFGVSCIAAGTCTAVGGSGSGTHVQTLVQSNTPSKPSAVS